MANKDYKFFFKTSELACLHLLPVGSFLLERRKRHFIVKTQKKLKQKLMHMYGKLTKINLGKKYWQKSNIVDPYSQVNTTKHQFMQKA